MFDSFRIPKIVAASSVDGVGSGAGSTVIFFDTGNRALGALVNGE